MPSPDLAIFGGVFALLIWGYLLFARGSFWHVQTRNNSQGETSSLPPRVAVVMPARNEADVIAPSISSLLHQTCSESIHIFLVDDGSTDDTVRWAREAASKAGKSAMLTVREGCPLPPGWTGKLWAIHQGLAEAREFNPDFFLLTDADILHARDSISTLAAIAEAGGYDLASYMVKLRCKTVAERLLIPAFVFFFFKLYPPAWIADSRRRTAGAAGGCILIRPDALVRAGGIESIRHEIIDDCALARAVKRSGGKVWLGLSASTSSLRRYDSFAQIGRMISRAAFNQLRHSALLLFFALLGLILTYLLPPALLFSGHPLPITLGAAACAAMVFAYLPLVRFYGLNPLWTLTLPLAALFYWCATLHSAFMFWSGRGGEWKGRVQDTRGS